MAPLRKCLFGAMALIGISISAAAHEGLPLYIELKETERRQYHLQWKIPPSSTSFNTPVVTLPKGCEPQGKTAQFGYPDGWVRRIKYICASGLAGQAIAIDYPASNQSTSSVIRYSTVSGEQHVAVLSPEETNWTVPVAETASNVIRQYAVLGITHISIGIDHLLFLICLLGIANTWRRILLTISGFTLAHSVTLVLSVLQVFRLPISPVEASIALSIVFVASEIVRGSRESLTWRHPVMVSSSFGLLHGFGFAAALSDFGLPKTELATALLSFNVGVEVGQLMFATGVIAVMRGVQRLSGKSPAVGVSWAPFRAVPGYFVGTLAVFWLMDRVAAF